MSIPGVLHYIGYALGISVLYRLAQLGRYFWRNYCSPLHELPGPSDISFFSFLGEFYDIRDTNTHAKKQARMKEKYGSQYIIQGILGLPTLMTWDTKTINSIVTSSAFVKQSEITYNLSKSVGQGLLIVEGDTHRRQRKILNPAFGPLQIREITEIFVDKSLKLEQILDSQIQQAGGQLSTDMMMWLNRMTLDVIGLAGFGHDFDALSDSPPTELSTALSTLLKAGSGIFASLQAFIPPLRVIPTKEHAEIKKARAAMKGVALNLLKDAKNLATSQGSRTGANLAQGRDILSILVRANLTADGPKLSEEEVIDQIPTFIVAGHETTSTAVTWTLLALSQAPEVQKKLREEFLSLRTDNPTMDQLNSLPYVENVVREVLRLYPPVPATFRQATEDIILPVSEPYIDRQGRKRSEIRMAKGDIALIHIQCINRSKDLWGLDAEKFRPERWNALPPEINTMPGVYGHLLSFLAGPHACIGYRFALVEWKAILFALLRKFEFELAVPVEEIESDSTVVQHPFLRNDKDRKHQLPVIIRPSKSTD